MQLPGFAGYAPKSRDLFIIRLSPGQDTTSHRFGIMFITEPESCDLFYIEKYPGRLDWTRSFKRKGVSYKTLLDIFKLRTAVLVAKDAYDFDLDWLWVSFSRFAGTPMGNDEQHVKAWVDSVLNCSFSLSYQKEWSDERRRGVTEWIWSSVTDFTIQGE